MSNITISEYQTGDELNFDFELYELGNSFYNFDNAKTIRIDNEIIAFITFNYFKDSELHIGLFEVVKKGQGFGSKIINWIKLYELISRIYINIPTVRAKNFWEKNGFLQESDEDWVWKRENN